jgi:hypothetical protein
MSIYIREPIFVLDVVPEGPARIQMHAYHEVAFPDGTMVETSLTQPLPTQTASMALRSFIDNGILPVVLLLNWSSEGNHFQAVIFDNSRHAAYTARYEETNTKRNEMLVEHGLRAFGSEAYSEDTLATAAKEALDQLSKSTKTERHPGHRHADEDSDDFVDPRLVPSTPTTVSTREHGALYSELLMKRGAPYKSTKPQRYGKELRCRNQIAFMEWIGDARVVNPDVLQHVKVSDLVDGMICWLHGYPKIMRTLLRSLPYPEFAIRSCSMAILTQWGEAEARLIQEAELRTIATMHYLTNEHRLEIQEWIQEASSKHEELLTS